MVNFELHSDSIMYTNMSKLFYLLSLSYKAININQFGFKKASIYLRVYFDKVILVIANVNAG